MQRTPGSLVLPRLLVLGAVGGWLAGCGGGNSGGTDAPRGAKPPKPAAAAKSQPALAGWKVPAAVLVFSGQQLGYIEPCGCAPETLAGGLGRRDDLIGEIRERQWPVAALDLGSTLHDARRQSAIKFDTILAAYHEMGYAGIGLGSQELNLGPDQLLAANHPDNAAHVPFVSANVVWYDTPDLPGGPLPFVTTKVGEKTIAVTSVLIDNPASSELVASDLYTVGDAEEGLRRVLPQIDAANPDLRVLLAHTREEAARKLLETFPEFDVVVCTGPEEPSGEPRRIGKSLLFSVGKKGKYVGVVGLFPGGEPTLRYELVHLDRFRFDETKRMHDGLRDYQKRLEGELVVATLNPVRHPREAEFTGAKVCGECHTKAFSKWSTSRHAHAFESLALGHVHAETKGDYPKSEHEWISRVYDPECLACHVTGWDPQEVLRYETGFLNAKFARTDEEKLLEARLGMQGCENCHGPGSRHVELERSFKANPKSVDDKTRRAAIAQMDLSIVLDPETNKPVKAVHGDREGEVNLCFKCHDQDNSPKFDSTTFADYWEKVRHPGKD